MFRAVARAVLVVVASAQVYRRSGGAPLIGPPMPMMQMPTAPVPVSQPLGEIFASKRIQWLPQMSAEPSVRMAGVPAAPPPIIVNDIRIRRVMRERSCGPNETLSGDQCIGTETCQPAMVCPPSSVREGSRCLSIRRPVVDCPLGEVLEAAPGPDSPPLCARCELVKAELKCPEGFSLNPQQQTCVRILPKDPVCPPGFELQRADAKGNPRCLHAVKPMLQCPPDGYVLAATGQCVRENVFGAALECPELTENEGGGECVSYVVPPPRCPPNFTMDGSQCIRHSSQVAEPCEAGERLQVDAAGVPQCEATRLTPAQRQCPPDSWEDNESSCVTRVPVPPSCAHGFVLTGEGCERHVAPRWVCGPGETLQGHECVATVIDERGKIECCPPGFEPLGDGSNCRRQERTAPQLSCSTDCVARTVIGKPAFVCPQGTEFAEVTGRGPVCLNAAARSACADPPAGSCLPEIDAPAQMAATADGPAEPEDLGAEGWEWHVVPSGEKRKEDDEMPRSRRKRRLHGEELEEVESKPRVLRALATCKQGSLENGNCFLQQPERPHKVCAIGEFDSYAEQCVREIIVPVKTECAPGTRRQGLHCVTEETRPAEVRCPEGTSETVTTETGSISCVERVPLECSLPRLLMREPQWMCPPHARLQGTQCLEAVRRPQKNRCREGSEPNGAGGCVEVMPVTQAPPQRKTEQGKLVCPPGSLRVGKNCVSSEQIEASRQCPENSFGNGVFCAVEAEPLQSPPQTITVAAEPACPPDGVLKGTSCLLQHKKPAKVSCAAGYKLELDRCVMQQPLRPHCSGGMELQGGACVREVRRPAFERLIEGCGHQVVPKECSTCPQQYTRNCAS